MARSANSRRGRTGVSSKAGELTATAERRPQMPHLTFIKEDSISLPATKMVATSLLGYREVGDIPPRSRRWSSIRSFVVSFIRGTCMSPLSNLARRIVASIKCLKEMHNDPNCAGRFRSTGRQTLSVHQWAE